MLKKIPLWGWVAGGGVLLVGALLLTSKRAPSSGSGETSPFTDLLSQLMTSLSNLQGSIQNPKSGATGATGATGAKGTAGSPGSTTPTSTGGSPTPIGGSVVPIPMPVSKNPPIAPTGHTSTSSATAPSLVSAQKTNLMQPYVAGQTSYAQAREGASFATHQPYSPGQTTYAKQREGGGATSTSKGRLVARRPVTQPQTFARIREGTPTPKKAIPRTSVVQKSTTGFNVRVPTP